jgi:DNA-binding response OmpR family regulator
MPVAPSCQILLVHDDDPFRRSLIATLDQRHFSVTYTPDDEQALKYLAERKFQVVLVAVNLVSRNGTKALAFLRENRAAAKCGVIILGDANPELRTFAPWADETLLKPVDAAYVAARARVYCEC